MHPTCKIISSSIKHNNSLPLNNSIWRTQNLMIFLWILERKKYYCMYIFLPHTWKRLFHLVPRLCWTALCSCVTSLQHYFILYFTVFEADSLHYFFSLWVTMFCSCVQAASRCANAQLLSLRTSHKPCLFLITRRNSVEKTCQLETVRQNRSQGIHS